MIISTTSTFRRLFLIIPILVIGVWLFAQNGCELTPTVKPTPALAVAGSQPLEPNSRSLQQASALLRQAADLIDKNDPLAVRLIRQVIAILKHEVMSGIDAPDYDRVSIPPSFEWNEACEQKPQALGTAFRILPSEDSEIIPQVITRHVEGPRALAFPMDA